MMSPYHTIGIHSADHHIVRPPCIQLLKQLKYVKTNGYIDGQNTQKFYFKWRKTAAYL